MATYIVIFDVPEPEKLSALKEELKSFSGYCPVTSGCWAVISEAKAQDIRDRLATVIGPADRLFVIRSGTEAAWRNAFSEQHTEWLKKNL